MPVLNSPRDRERYLVARLREFFGERDLRTLAPRDVRAYIEYRQGSGVGPATINRELGTSSAALNWARRDLEWQLPNPVMGRLLKPPEGRLRWLSRQEADRWIAAARKQSRAKYLVDFLELALHTGMRRGEMLKLEWQRVDLDEGLVYLRGADQKNGKFGSVPLNATAKAALVRRDAFRQENRLSSPWVFTHKDSARVASVKCSFATACTKAGIEDFRIHDLRHCCAAWLVQAGVSIRAVAELLRHWDIRVTMRYAHLAPETVRAAVSVLDAESRFGHGADLDKREKEVNPLI
jgi:integrase